jgi:hypothetical protein
MRLPLLSNLYSMFYDADTITAAFLDFIGWRQNSDSSGIQLKKLSDTSSAYVAPTSGEYFNAQHPMLTFDNVEAVAPDFENEQGLSGDDLNVAVTDWLVEETKAGILQVIGDWFAMKDELKTAKDLIERNQLLEVSNRNVDYDRNLSQWVGQEIRPVGSRNIKVKVSQISLQFEEAQDVDVYLFRHDQVNPVQSETISYTTANQVQWETVDWTLDGGVSYFLVYNQAAVSGRSVNGVQDYRWSSHGLVEYPTGRFIRSSAFSLVSTIDASSMWDIAQNRYTTDTNYGLNFRYHTFCDFTDFIVEQKELLKNVILKGVAMHFLQMFVYNPPNRVNRKQANYNVDRIQFEIEGNPEGRKTGLRYRYEQALKAASVDTELIDSICLPCRKRGVIYRSIP